MALSTNQNPVDHPAAETGMEKVNGYFRRCNDDVELFFPPQIMFFRAYIVDSPDLREALKARMKVLECCLLGAIAVTFVACWLSERIGLCLALGLTGIETVFWVLAFPLLRQLKALPIRLSVSAYAADFSTLNLLFGIGICVFVGTAAIVGGVVGNDLSWVVLGCGLMIWGVRLFVEVVVRWMKALR